MRPRGAANGGAHTRTPGGGGFGAVTQERQDCGPSKTGKPAKGKCFKDVNDQISTANSLNVDTRLVRDTSGNWSPPPSLGGGRNFRGS